MADVGRLCLDACGRRRVDASESIPWRLVMRLTYGTDLTERIKKLEDDG